MWSSREDQCNRLGKRVKRGCLKLMKPHCSDRRAPGISALTLLRLGSDMPKAGGIASASAEARNKDRLRIA